MKVGLSAHRRAPSLGPAPAVVQKGKGKKRDPPRVQLRTGSITPCFEEIEGEDPIRIKFPNVLDIPGRKPFDMSLGARVDL